MSLKDNGFYIVGDVQGCAVALQRLLRRLPEAAEVWFCGDLVNRGSGSLSVLRQIRALGSRAKVVLGNHDIHLLAVANGARLLGRSDTLDEILSLPGLNEWLDWLRFLPLAHFEYGVFMSHAGILPEWSVEDALLCAAELEAVLRSDDYGARLKTIFGNTPSQWDGGLKDDERLRVITNAFTRMRMCDASGAMDFGFKGELVAAPNELMPWFRVPSRKVLDTPIFFGHWSALGLHSEGNVTCLDTGCVWGRELTAYHYPSGRLLTARE